MKAEYIRVESEHSAISAALGASGAGVRVFTATSSQGLALMHEILFAAAGMRSPIVLVDANRALSAPLSIWNDQQDTISERDSGWLQIYAENAQEALDAVLIAYRVAEDRDVLLPCMVCIDGYFLTHTVEPLEVPSQEEVDQFLPPYKPYAFLDPENPMSIGTFTDPEYYMEARYAIEEAMERSKEVIAKANEEFAQAAISLGVSAEQISNLNWGTLFTKNLIPVTLGNIVGGAFFVGTIYWFVYLKKGKSAQ